VKSQFDGLLSFINAHINLATGSHAASAISYAGSGNWKDATTVSGATVEAAIDEVVSDLAADAGAARVGIAARSSWLGGRTNPAGVSIFDAIEKVITDLAVQTASDDGAERIGAQASGNLAAGSVRSQLDAIDATAVRTNVANTFTANQTLAANLLADATGRDIGSSAARFDAFLRNVSATSSGAGVPAVQGFAPDTTTPTVRASGAVNGFTESEGLRASHDEFFFFLTEIWDYLRGWVFIPMHTGDVPDATELNAVTQRNIVKAWGSVQSNGTLNSPHWNVASVTKNGTGLYQVTLDVSPGSISAVIVTVNSSALNADFSTHVFGPDGGDFEVDINSSGVLSDQAFMFVVLGA
jgi:hypothetical protein